MERRVLILSAGVGSGHNSAAAAIEASLAHRPDIAEVRTLDVLDTTSELYKGLYDDTYFQLVSAVPWLVRWGYDVNDPPFRLGGSLPVVEQLFTTAAARQIRDFLSDVVVCTHFMPTRLVSLMQTRGTINARLGVVTTDYDVQGLWLTNTFTRFFLAREEAKAHLAALGLPKDRMTVSGIPVRRGLATDVDRDAVLAEFGLTDDSPVVLVSAGAAGGDYARRIVEQLMELSEPFQAVVVSGRNTALKDQLTQLVGRRTDRFRILGFTNRMSDLMRIASLFVGKPGGLSSSECMAAGLPMVLVDPIPGQEERNSDYLLEEGAAVRCNFDSTIGWKVGTLLSHPDRLERMAERARVVGRPAAALSIVSELLGDGDDPLWISDRAQRSVHAATESGGQQDLRGKQRLRTLADPESGRSRVLVTEAQRRRLAKSVGAAENAETFVLDRSRLERAAQLLLDPSLVLTLHNVLGHRQQQEFAVR